MFEIKGICMIFLRFTEICVIFDKFYKELFIYNTTI